MLSVIAPVRKPADGDEWINPDECASIRAIAEEKVQKTADAHSTLHTVHPVQRYTVLGDVAPYRVMLRRIIEAAETLACDQEATLPKAEMRGDQKKVTPANMFLSCGASDVKALCAEARALLDE